MRTVEQLAGDMRRLPQTPSLLSRDFALDGRQPRMGNTTAVLRALTLAAEAEMRELHLDPDTNINPITRLIEPPHVDPLFVRLRAAVRKSASAALFGAASTTSDHDFVEGQRVRLAIRPNDEIALPNSIRVGDYGTLMRRSNNIVYGQGWEVTFDNHGTWWTTTDSLEPAP